MDGRHGPPRDLLRAITQRLLDDNAGRMPEEIENGICDLFSTIEVNGTKVKLGAPLAAGELSGERLRGWAKLQMLATQPEYTGKLRAYINNMENAGEEDQATRNAFDTTAAKLAAQVDAYLKAGKFEGAPVNGKALSPSRDFIEKNVDHATVDALLAEIAAGGKSFPPDSPRGLLAQNTMPALELAIRANPKWAEPQFKIAALETDRARRIARLKMAASLAPRNAIYWQRRWRRRNRPPICSRMPRSPGPRLSARRGIRRKRLRFIAGQAQPARGPGGIRGCRKTAPEGRRCPRPAAGERFGRG